MADFSLENETLSNVSNLSTDSSLSEPMSNRPEFAEPSPARDHPAQGAKSASSASASKCSPSPSNGSMASPMSPFEESLNNTASTADNVIKRLEQENRVLKMEIDTLKLRIKGLVEENKGLRAASVSIQARAEQEEEFISNTLLKRIQVLKKEKETLALNYEQEEECLTNDLSRKLNQLRAEKVQLEKTLEQEQEALVNKLMRKIEKLEGETQQKQQNLEQLRREKIELENTLEQEQESLVNKLWKRMDKLEHEKRNLQGKLEDYNKGGGGGLPGFSLMGGGGMSPSSSPSPQPSPGTTGRLSSLSNNQLSGDSNVGIAASPLMKKGNNNNNQLDAQQLSFHVQHLKHEVSKLKGQLILAEREHVEKMARFEREEREQREQNIRLQRKLQIEMERREQLCRHLSESESSLEMDEERQFNEHQLYQSTPTTGAVGTRPRTLSSPIPPSHAVPYPPPPSSNPISLPPIQRPLSPQHAAPTSCPNCGLVFPLIGSTPTTSPVMSLKPKESKFMKHC